MPKWRYQGGDSTCGDGAGKYAKRKKPGDIGRGCEIRKIGGAAAQEQSAEEGFSDIEERQDQPANDSMMSGKKTANELRDISRAEIGWPTPARSQKQISKQNTICDPDEIGLGGKADEYRGQNDGEKASCEAQGETVPSQPATNAARGFACNIAAQRRSPEGFIGWISREMSFEWLIPAILWCGAAAAMRGRDQGLGMS